LGLEGRNGGKEWVKGEQNEHEPRPNGENGGHRGGRKNGGGVRSNWFPVKN